MKTYDQIIRYTTHCKFSSEDWEKVRAFCHEYENGGHIHKSKSTISESTYEEFIKWIENGFGSGDMVSYGNTMGIIGDNTPDKTYLVAYCDYEGNLIVKDMEIFEPERLSHLSDERKLELKKKLFENNLDYTVKTSNIIPMYTPQKNLYYVLGDRSSNDYGIGMYSESRDNKYIFSAFLQNGKLEVKKEIDIDYTPLRPASDKEIKRLHKALDKSGLVFNEKIFEFIKRPERGDNNPYWYLNDRFQIVMDRDNGEKRHGERFEAGNYFLDNTEALFFMVEVKKLRKEEF